MNKIFKTVIIAIAFIFVTGCDGEAKPAPAPAPALVPVYQQDDGFYKMPLFYNEYGVKLNQHDKIPVYSSVTSAQLSEHNQYDSVEKKWKTDKYACGILEIKFPYAQNIDDLKNLNNWILYSSNIYYYNKKINGTLAFDVKPYHFGIYQLDSRDKIKVINSQNVKFSFIMKDYLSIFADMQNSHYHISYAKFINHKGESLPNPSFRFRITINAEQTNTCDLN